MLVYAILYGLTLMMSKMIKWLYGSVCITWGGPADAVCRWSSAAFADAACWVCETWAALCLNLDRKLYSVHIQGTQLIKCTMQPRMRMRYFHSERRTRNDRCAYPLCLENKKRPEGKCKGKTQGKIWWQGPRGTKNIQCTLLAFITSDHWLITND